MVDVRVIHVGMVLRWKNAPVRVMALAEGWAMVRRKGAMPFVVRVSELAQGE